MQKIIYLFTIDNVSVCVTTWHIRAMQLTTEESTMDDVIIIHESITVMANGKIDFPELTDEQIKLIQERFAAANKKN